MYYNAVVKESEERQGMKQRLKKMYETTIVILFLLFCLISIAFGLWFLQGGDIRDIQNGCFNAGGCN
jgi:hypothetical protein